MKYQLNRLEEKIQQIYTDLCISNPSEIDPYHIANEYNVWIYFHEDESEVYKRKGKDSDLYSMYLDERLSFQEQWQDFCHEFGHVVEHVGNQNKLQKPFRKLQERQANNFMYHFAVPSFMLLNYEIANYYEDGVFFIADTFNVTKEFAYRRLEMFRRQLKQADLDKQFVELVNNEKVFNYCKNIEPRKFSKAAEDMMALAIQMKLAKKGVGV